VKTVLTPTENLARVHGRGSLLSILERETILTRIKVFNGGHFTLETSDWDSYWQPLHKLGHKKVEENLDALHSAWRDYLHSEFSSAFRQEFCFRYFSLLNVILSIQSESEDTPRLNVLHSVLGFECFGITSSAPGSEVLGAGTCTIRNPCYLLAKLKMPDALDDTQFLPIITVAGTKKPELFYHYRQYTLSLDSPISLMLYPAVSEEKRSASFRLLNSLAGGVRYAADPWTSERAQQLFRGIVYPIVQTIKPAGVGKLLLELVDVGAGSGSLASRLCHYVQKVGAVGGVTPKFCLWSVDLKITDPARFFRKKNLRSLADSLYYLGDDYRSWLSRPQPLPSTDNLRIALVSKLLDVISHFSILFLPLHKMLSILPKASLSSEFEEHLPIRCLAPDGKGAKELAISNSRFSLPEGKGFMQASLSEFYKGIFLILSNETENNVEKGVYLPVRTFNSECLITLNGKSVISCLADNCDYIIIEDADLAPEDLVAHAKAFSLFSIAIYNMTKALRLKGNYAYVIWSKKKAAAPSITGEQIW
jgi:hypothetical protein